MNYISYSCRDCFIKRYYSKSIKHKLFIRSRNVESPKPAIAKKSECRRQSIGGPPRRQGAKLISIDHPLIVPRFLQRWEDSISMKMRERNHREKAPRRSSFTGKIVRRAIDQSFL